jgi:ribonuclease BN (tRNA processing enzyme)
MPKVIFLGSASGQTSDRETVSFILEGQKRILVETGPAVIRQMERAGYRPWQVDAVVVTHCHGDHTLGYPYFMFGKHIDKISNRGGPDQISVLATSAVIDGLQSMLSFCYPPGEWPTFGIDEVSLTENPEGMLWDEIPYKTTPVKHSVPNIAISFELDGKKVTYSSDTVYSDSLVDLASGSDLLIQEAMVPNSMKGFSEKTKHATTGDAARIASEAGVRQVILVHLDPPWFEKEEQIVEEVRSGYEGEVNIAHDLEDFNF